MGVDMMPSIHLEGAGRDIDSDVLNEIVALRLFVQERFGDVEDGNLTASAGHCFDVAHVVAAALTDRGHGEWAAWEGLYWTDEALVTASGMAKTRPLAPSDVDLIAQFHGFVLSPDGNFLVDLTADQFGLPGIVVTDNPERRWTFRYPNEVYYEPSKGDAWLADWRSEREEWVARAREAMRESFARHPIPAASP